MEKLTIMKVIGAGSLVLAATGLSFCSSNPDESYVSSRSYKGHETDVDANNFVSVYRAALGTRLDDCQLCHAGGTFTTERGGETVEVFVNACDFCHLIIYPTTDYNEPLPTTYSETLNPYGVDYMNAGRSRGALREIAGRDSDGDGYSNGEEIESLKYPGDPASMPGQPTAPTIEFTMEELAALPVHEQFLLANSHKQQFDNYAGYKGVKIRDLLLSVGVDPETAPIQGISVIAPDGYVKDFTVEEINNPFPQSLFYDGLDTSTLGIECGFVQYPDVLPEGLTDGGPIPDEQWLMLAYEREGLPMGPSNLDITSGKINGEGPYRIIVPQTVPGSPDRGSNYSPTNCNDGWDYDDSKDHNAGAMVRGVIAIRINPLPGGYEDFDYHYGGWAYIDSQSLIVYGTGISSP